MIEVFAWVRSYKDEETYVTGGTSSEKAYISADMLIDIVGF
jgi:hypothetical protein